MRVFFVFSRTWLRPGPPRDFNGKTKGTEPKSFFAGMKLKALLGKLDFVVLIVTVPLDSCALD